jgi:hypothetical protein
MRARLAAFVAALAGSAVLGLLAGLIWSAIAPRALLQEISQGTADVVNAETSAFVAADGWFCVVGAVAGIITGAFGYWLLVRRWQGAAAAGLILGGLAGALVALWTGEHIGVSGYQHDLAFAATGTYFRASLALGAKSALTFWPMLTAITIGLIEMTVRRAGSVRDPDPLPLPPP